jgi:hypothetical protein
MTCPDLKCNIPPQLPKELDKVLCDEIIITKTPCKLSIVGVSVNVIDLQHQKMYSKVCSGRHDIKDTKVYRIPTKPKPIINICPNIHICK